MKQFSFRISLPFLLIFISPLLYGQSVQDNNIAAPVNVNQNNPIPQLPEPPYFTITGNPAADSTNYSIAKEVWISDCVFMIESHLGQMDPVKKEKFKAALRGVDIEAARHGDYTLPIIENPYSVDGKVELH
jgi:hypothetical protein